MFIMLGPCFIYLACSTSRVPIALQNIDWDGEPVSYLILVDNGDSDISEMSD